MRRWLRSRSLLVAMAMVVSVVRPCAAFVQETGTSILSDRPVVKAAALYMIELQSGKVLLEKNATRRLPPASLTKIMTAMVALKSGSLEQVVTIDPRALVNRSSLGFHSGERFFLRDVLTAMLVNSANDACEAVALHVAETEPKFVAKMNEQARALNLKDTHFANPCGFDAPGHYSTAVDLAKLTDHALHVPAFSMMVRTVTRTITTVDGKRQVSLHSTNELLLDPDVTGVKTGYTSKAGRCLIASMFKEGHRLLLVGLNVDDQWEQANHLLRYGQALLQGHNE